MKRRAKRVEDLVRSNLEGLDSIPVASSLGKRPLDRFLHYWAPERCPKSAKVAPSKILAS